MDIEWIQDATAVTGEQCVTAEGRVVIAGLGNIGSYAAELVARMPEVHAITLCDPGVFEAKNLHSQSIAAAAVNKAKVSFVARRLAAVRGDLRITAIQRRVQDVPLGTLRADVILGCLDSRSARCYVNEAARALGAVWVDAGVEPSSLLARVNTYRPTPDSPCYECSFSTEDYRHLDVVNPCGSRQVEAPATNAPACLGALAAALQVLEAAKVLRRQWDLAAVGKQVTVAAGMHRHYVTAFEVNPKCRCGHAAWVIHPACVGAQATLGEMAALLPGAAMSVFGQTFAGQWACTACTFQSRKRMPGELAGRRRMNCRRCGAVMRPVGYAQSDSLQLDALLPQHAGKPLASLGMEDGDVVTLRRGDEWWHVMLGQEHAAGGDKGVGCDRARVQMWGGHTAHNKRAWQQQSRRGWHCDPKKFRGCERQSDLINPPERLGIRR